MNNAVGLFKNFSKKKIGVIIFIDLLVAISFTLLYVFVEGIPQTAFIIVCSITLILLMMLINELTSRIVMAQMKKKNHNPKTYELENFDSIITSLKEQNAEITKYYFGTNYLFVKGENAYRVCVVEDNNLYFNRQTNEKNKPNKKLEKCKRFYGLEIFKNPTDDIISKIELFTFQSDNVCYSGYYYKAEDKQLIQALYEEPLECHKENYNFIIDLLGAKEIKEENVSFN
ncbi:MAG: hypothetical protein R3Y21_04170 [Mycoplasmatota bacterium]